MALSRVPVKSIVQHVPCDCAQRHFNDLPVEFSVHGIVAAVLDCAGDSRSALLKAEIGWTYRPAWPQALPAHQRHRSRFTSGGFPYFRHVQRGVRRIKPSGELLGQ